MNTTRIIIGTIALLAPLSALAAPVSLYESLRQTTRAEVSVDGGYKAKAEPALARFAAKEVSAMLGRTVLRSEVDLALGGRFDAFCAAQPYRPSLGYDFRCQAAAQEIRNLVEREERGRTLGRDLLLLATSYELPLRDWPAESADGIVRIWRAGGDSGAKAATDGVIRSLPLPQTPAVRTALERLRASLLAIVRPADPRLQRDPDAYRIEQFTAAVWRYRHGYRSVQNEPPGQIADPSRAAGTQMQYQTIRWPAVEQTLAAIHLAALQDTAPDPPLLPGEILRFKIPANVQDLFPPNVMLWIEAETGQMRGDAGLAWRFPLEPVQASLCRHTQREDVKPEDNHCEPILGGLYPRPLRDGAGLCARAVARAGYLCRPLSFERCDTAAAGTPNTFTLSACKPAPPPADTFSGPDACAERYWRLNREAFNPATQCRVKLVCSSNPKIEFEGKTKPKDKDGIIEITFRGTANALLMLHELTHAKQLCNLPPETSYAATVPWTAGFIQKYDSAEIRRECCRMEGEAYRLQFQALGASGVFDDPNPPKDVREMKEAFQRSGVPFNAETLAQLVTDTECRAIKAGACPASFSFAYKEDHPLIRYFHDRLQEKKQGTTCGEIIAGGTFNPGDPMEKIRHPVIRSQVREILETGFEPCNPNRVTRYENTIGGNLCYMDQCLEQTLERHRLIPGRLTTGANEPAFPFDGTGKGYPAFRGNIAKSAARTHLIPPYRPGFLMQAFDASLCQVNGLPAGTPPSLCAFETTRGIVQNLESALSTAFSLEDQRREYAASAAGFEGQIAAAGLRIGNTLYEPVLRGAALGLSDVIADANALLRNFTKVSFTRTMCPLNATQDLSIYAP